MNVFASSFSRPGRLCATLLGSLLLTVGAWAGETAPALPRVFSLPPGALAKAKERLAAREGAVAAPFQQLIAEADKALKQKPLSVMDKPQNPPGGDKHDYMSQAPYFWPDPSKPDGLPYLRKDGQRNPESHDEHSDSPRMGRVCSSAQTLALAWHFTGKDAYAEQAAKLLRVWFLDPATRMNPNFNFAQAVPGVNTGRGTGMIESRSVVPAMDAVGLLAGSKTWTKADDDGMKAWMGEFLTWAQTSPNGKDEAAAKNNHGSFYDEQIVMLALFLGKEELAKKTLEAVKTRRIAVQIKADGSQPLELSRADSFGYSRFNIEALVHLATMGEHVGVDLWHYQSPEGGGLRQAISFLLPYVEDQDKPWPYENGKKATRNLASELWRAAAVYGDERFARAAKKASGFDKSRDVLFFPGK